MGKLNGKVALITGGSSGIGLATAELFAREGAQVIISGRNQAALDDALRMIGGSACAIRADVCRSAEIKALYQRLQATYGRLDILVANAGSIQPAPFDEVTQEQLDAQIDSNIKGVFYSAQGALPLLSDGATLVLVSSIAHFKALDGHCVYSATKAAVRAFARSWAYELKDRGIRVNCLSPGPVKTPIIAKMGISDEQFADFEHALGERIPLGRLGRPEELAEAALFLASDSSSFITGIDLCADGGMAQL